jgi:hypothetical protein
LIGINNGGDGEFLDEYQYRIFDPQNANKSISLERYIQLSEDVENKG